MLEIFKFCQNFKLDKVKKKSPLGKVCAVAPEPNADEKSLLTPTEKPVKLENSNLWLAKKPYVTNGSI